MRRGNEKAMLLIAATVIQISAPIRCGLFQVRERTTAVTLTSAPCGQNLPVMASMELLEVTHVK